MLGRLTGLTLWPRSRDRNGYPFDFDASLRYTRPRVGFDVFPYPTSIGAISGTLRQFDALIVGYPMAKAPSGPGVTTTPSNLQWQMIVPGLSKQG